MLISGYRYFETIPGAKEQVSYPFGYGLSYSDFEIDPGECSISDWEVHLNAYVVNRSKRPGREVVQVYAELPQGKLGKPALTLVSFGKTRLLSEGEEEMLDLSFPLENLASYDDEGKVQKSAWLLEAGDYELCLGRNVRDLMKVPSSLRFREEIVLEQLSEKCAPKKLSKRLRADGSFEALKTQEYPERILGLDMIPDLASQSPSPAQRAVPSIQVHGPRASQNQGIIHNHRMG